MTTVDEQRHKVRMEAEPAIFALLQDKYGEHYKQWWNDPTTSFSKTSKNKVLLVERRPHPNFLFVIQNAMYFCKDFSLVVVCSNESEGFVREQLGRHASTTDIRPLFKGIGTRNQGRNEYNQLFMSADFWKSLDAEFILSIQTDAYLLTPLDESMWTYDYIACPWKWNQDLVGGGGLTWRNVQCCIDICEAFSNTVKSEDKQPLLAAHASKGEDISQKEQQPLLAAHASKGDDISQREQQPLLAAHASKGEDCFFSEGCRALGKKIPPFPERYMYFVETMFYEKPIGVHQWWTYVFTAPEMSKTDKEYLFTQYTTIQI